MTASTSQVGRLLQSDSPSNSFCTRGTATDNIQNACAPQNFVNFSVLCMHDFDPEDAGLLSFRKNEILDVIKRDDSGWWAAIQQDGPTGPLVGWIPQAYVSVLSEEMAIKLRGKGGKRDRVDDYPGPLFDGSPTAVMEGCPSPSVMVDDDPHFQQYPFPSGHISTDKSTHGNEDGNAKRNSSDSGTTAQSYTTSSSIPLPPSRSASFKRGWRPQASFPDGTRPRAGSLTASRSGRRQALPSNELRLAKVETSKPRELIKMPSSSFAGTVETLYKRIGDDKTQWRKASDDASVQLHRPACLRIVAKYELDEDDKGRVRSGTLPALIERLTLEMPTDPTKRSESKAFSDTFLMTFRTFTTANVFFDMLLERYYMPPPSDLPETTTAEWIAHIRRPLRLRVLEIFAAWLEEQRLLEEEPYIGGRLVEFLNSIDDASVVGNAESLLQTIQRLTLTTPSKLATTVSPKKARKSKAYKNELSKMDPVDIVEQLTLLEFRLYVKVTPQECLTYAKTRSCTTVANLVEFCSTHDKLASWVKSSVLNNDALSKRADMVDFWIKVAEKCRFFNNFSSMAAIVTALSATVLTQLHLTWAHVSRKSTLEALLRYNEPTGGFSGYRSLLQEVEGPCVPFITMYLTDIIHASQHSRDETDVIFFFQRARWHEVIAQMLKFQSRPYKIAPSETTTQFIDAHLREVLCDDNWFWQRSRELQQAETAHADIRKGLEAAGF